MPQLLPTKSLLTVALMLPAAALQAQSLTVNVFPSLAPNAFGSPSYSQYSNNAVQALMANPANPPMVGDRRTTPTGWEVAPLTIRPDQAIVTNFFYWEGKAPDPRPAFQSELGTRITFALAVTSSTGTDRNGKQFSLSGLTFNLVSSNSDLNIDGRPESGEQFSNGDVYSPANVGVLYGSDGKLGGGDDTLITSGSASQKVDALFYRGIGNAFAVYDTDPGMTNQDKINNFISGGTFNQPITVSMNYTLYADQSDTGTPLGSGDAMITISAVPEPSSVAISGFFGAALLVGALRKRRASRG